MGTPFFVFSGGLAAWGKGLPSASRLRAGHVPPAPPACGPTPCPPCAAAVPPPAPSSPLRGLAGEMWRPRPRLRRVLVKLAASRCAGHPSAMQGQAPAGRAKGPALHCSSPAPVAAQVLRGGPAPTRGGFGAVRPSGPVGGAPASLASPATPTAQAVPLGSAYALAARRSGPGPLAGGSAPQPSRGPGCGLLLQPLPLRGAAIKTAARTGGASAAFPALRARRGAGNAACGRECRPLPRPARPRQAPRRAASRPQAGALPASAPASDGQTWRVSRPVRASRPFSFW